MTSNLAERGGRWKRVPCCLHTHPHLWRSFPSSQKTHDKGNHHSSLFSLSQTHTRMRVYSPCTHSALAYFSMAPQYLRGKRSKPALNPYKALMIWPLDISPDFSSTTYLQWPCPASHSKKTKEYRAS